jgi:hypothetical protein
MIEEIRQHVSFLRTGDRLLPGVVAKFAKFHRWTLEQIKAKELLPVFVATVDRWTPSHMALERLLVLLATIPRLEPAERRARADEITEACDYLDKVLGILPPPELPIVNVKELTVAWKGTTYVVSIQAAQLFRLLIEHYPKPVSVKKCFPDNDIRPARIKAALPIVLANLIDTGRGKPGTSLVLEGVKK